MLGLPDYVTSDLRVLFVGINPGLRSAVVGHHFAGHSNRFWKLLADSRLVPRPVNYWEDARLLEWGIGLTNLVARPTTGTHELTQKDYRRGRFALLKKIAHFRPKILALLGIGMARILFSESQLGNVSPVSKTMQIKPGLQTVCLHQSQVFVLPNPSGRNAHYSYQAMSRLFQALGQMVNPIR
ncbi:MAG: mismatch-specific DNA-glycosylase [Nitrospirales bacterium]